MRNLIFLVISIAFFSCGKEEIVAESSSTLGIDSIGIVSFYLTSENGKVYEPFLVDDSTIHVYVGKEADLGVMALSMAFKGNSAYVDKIPYTEGLVQNYEDFTHPHCISLISKNGLQSDWTIILYDLPVLIIDTPERVPITSKTVKTEGCEVKMIDGLGGANYEGTSGVEGRGNSTWDLAKKPYNIKLEKKFGFFGLPKSKHWVLLANAFWDRTQMHNAVAYEMARMTDYPWVQDGRFVELIFNGTHQGLYYMCEKIRVESGRIEIDIMEPSDTIPKEMNGGFLLESAFYPEVRTFQTDYFNKTDAGNQLYWHIKKPEETLQDSQAEYIKGEMNRVESLILNEDSVSIGRYRNYLDIESVINWMLVEEATQNQESQNPSNLFIYKDKGGKQTFGPPWDFDAHTFGVYGQERTFLMRPSFYIYWMTKDAYFVNRLKEKWTTYKAVWESRIPYYIDDLYRQIHRSALRNEQMWPEWHPYYYYPEKSFEGLIYEMKRSFFLQLDYLDSIIKTL